MDIECIFAFSLMEAIGPGTSETDRPFSIFPKNLIDFINDWTTRARRIFNIKISEQRVKHIRGAEFNEASSR